MLKKNEMYINDTDVYDYHARLVSYKVGGTKITQNYITATNPVVPAVFSQAIGTRILTVTLSFECSGDNNIKRMSSNLAARSVVDAIFINSTPVTLKMPDRFYYTSILTNVSEVTPDLSDSIDVTYTFEAIMHDSLVTVTSSGTSNNFFIDVAGNVAANCVIKMTPLSMCDMTFCVRDARDYSTVVVPTITIQQAQGAQSLIIDGEKRTVAISGQNYMQYCDIISFPRLPPGRHAVYVTPEYKSVPIQTAISYYPTYV